MWLINSNCGKLNPLTRIDAFWLTYCWTVWFSLVTEAKSCRIRWNRVTHLIISLYNWHVEKLQCTFVFVWLELTLIQQTTKENTSSHSSRVVHKDKWGCLHIMRLVVQCVKETLTAVRYIHNIYCTTKLSSAIVLKVNMCCLVQAEIWINIKVLCSTSECCVVDKTNWVRNSSATARWWFPCVMNWSVVCKCEVTALRVDSTTILCWIACKGAAPLSPVYTY